MAEWKEITKEKFDAPAEPTTDYQTLWEMWREEKNKRQKAEEALTKALAGDHRVAESDKIIMDKMQEIESLKKNFQIEREVHQAEILTKDQEIGRLMKKISLKS
jgi:hypothetical protein